jgi:DNA-binding NtrC family response regulator
VPPLRERREDIAALATQFLRAASLRLGRVVPKVPQREMAKLVAYDWPGNVRELQHVVERAVILAPTGRAIHFDVAPSSAALCEPPPPERPYRTEHEWRRMERGNLLAALKEARGKVTGPAGAAALLGINPNTLASRLRALGFKKKFVDPDEASA